MHISTENISQMVTDITETITAANIESCMWPFDLHTYIWPWPILKVTVKVIHISTENISQMVTYKENITNK